MNENQQTEQSTAWRYAIYAGKSTENAEKQVRSIDDQVKDCLKLAKDYGLTVVGEPIKETKSAKIPNKRPLFSALLNEVKSGRIGGIIAWHPDRLARNMVEAGRIIHMLDTGVLKDLRFKSHQFSNDANGKMLLGMLFVFAKHYSDDLKTKVDRGIQNNFAEGKSGGTPKHGYIRDDEGIHRPDGDNFKLIQQAWQLRSDGKTEIECATYLNNNGYKRYVKKAKAHQQPRMYSSNMSRMFTDTFYFGILNQAGGSVDLRTAPIPFTPVVDEETYYKIQSLSRRKIRGPGKKRSIFLPLRELVFCEVCNYTKPMTVGRSKDRMGRHLLYYRCKNKDCTRKPSNMRAKIIFDGMASIIAKKIDTLTSEAYATYVQDVKTASSTQKIKMREELSRMQVVLRGNKKRQHELSVSLGKLTSQQAIQSLNQEIEALSADIVALEIDIERHQGQLAKSDLPMLTSEEFEARIKRASARFKKGDKFQKDAIVREMFLKLHVDNEKVASYLWKEPYLSLVETSELLHGAPDRI